MANLFEHGEMLGIEPAAKVKCDRSKDGWSFHPDSVDDGDCTRRDIALLNILNGERGRLSYKEARERLKSSMTAPGNLRHLEAIMENPGSIPDAWRAFRIVAPGTVFKGPGDVAYVAFYAFRGKSWVKRYRACSEGFDPDFRFIVAA